MLYFLLSFVFPSGEYIVGRFFCFNVYMPVLWEGKKPHRTILFFVHNPDFKCVNFAKCHGSVHICFSVEDRYLGIAGSCCLGISSFSCGAPCAWLQHLQWVVASEALTPSPRRKLCRVIKDTLITASS